MRKDSIKHFPANGDATLSGVIVEYDENWTSNKVENIFGIN